jgi:hypothetical protein
MGRNARLRARHRDQAHLASGLRRSPGTETDWQVVSLHESAAPMGPDVVSADLQTVFAAIRNAPRGDDWEAVRELVIPVLPRVRPQPPGVPPPYQRILAPGITVGFAADIGPAFMLMTTAQCNILGITGDQLVAQSLANLVLRAEGVDKEQVFHDTDGEATIAALQTGCSIASTLVLLPDQVARLLGPDPALLLAPMRDLLLALPADVDADLAAWWFDAFASQDPNHLAPVAYRFDGRGITPFAMAATPISARRLDS